MALIPAAGRASRLGGPSGSKEILPVGASRRPVARFLLDGLARAGIDRGFVMIRASKWDIPQTLGAGPLGTGSAGGVRLAYVTVAQTRSICETLDLAYPFVRDQPVALGFPDILFRPEDAFARIVERWRSTDADAVLALVPTDRPHKADIVRSTPDGRVLGIAIKPPREAGPQPGNGPTDRPLTWIGAVWSPVITALLHELVAAGAPGTGELYPSHVLLEALARGMTIEAVPMPDGRHLDVGTPEDLERATRWPE